MRGPLNPGTEWHSWLTTRSNLYTRDSRQPNLSSRVAACVIFMPAISFMEDNVPKLKGCGGVFGILSAACDSAMLMDARPWSNWSSLPMSVSFSFGFDESGDRGPGTS